MMIEKNSFLKNFPSMELFNEYELLENTSSKPSPLSIGQNLMLKLKNLEKRESIPVIPKLENVRGLLGTKFKFKKIKENNHKPWEFVTIKSTKLLKYYNDSTKRKTMISLSNHCMIKAYPQNFDSTNYDIIKCWAMGVQAAAINIQATKDDYTLFNIIGDMF